MIHVQFDCKIFTPFVISKFCYIIVMIITIQAVGGAPLVPQPEADRPGGGERGGGSQGDRCIQPPEAKDPNIKPINTSA